MSGVPGMMGLPVRAEEAATIDPDTRTAWVDDMTLPRYASQALVDGNVGSTRAYDKNGTQVGNSSTVYIVSGLISLVDQRVVGKFRFVGSTSGAACGVVLKGRSTTLALRYYVDSASIDVFLGTTGFTSVAASAAFASALVADVDYWLDAKIIGNAITFKVFSSDPDIGNPVPLASTTGTLVTTNATNLGATRCGPPGYWAATGAASQVRFKDWRFKVATS